jgi:hypothetical protein
VRGPLGVAFALVWLAAGCGEHACRDGTVLVRVDYLGAASAADHVSWMVSVDGGPTQSFVLPRTGSASSDTVEIDFASRYPAGSTLDITATATHLGDPIGSGTTAVTLIAGCSNGTLEVRGSEPDAGMPLDAAATLDGSTVDTAVPAAPDGALFFDDFDRADSTTIGNGWIAKRPAFDIAGQTLLRHATGPNYSDNVLYRPVAEARADVWVSAIVRFYKLGSNNDYPQILARIDPTTVATAGTLDAYLLFPANGGTTTMVITRQRGPESGMGGTSLGNFQLNMPFDVDHVFRFNLIVSGATPVTILGSVEIFDNGSQSWISDGSAAFTDTDPQLRLTSPGVMGVSGSSQDQSGDFSYDDFTVRPAP